MEADLAVYIRDYVATVSSLWAPRGVEVDVQSDGEQLERKFRPIEVGILIDNLVSNAVKARAAKVRFFLKVAKGSNPELTITVADDGMGWPQSLNPIERVFEKGVTTTDGSGLWSLPRQTGGRGFGWACPRRNGNRIQRNLVGPN